MLSLVDCTHAASTRTVSVRVWLDGDSLYRSLGEKGKQGEARLIGSSIRQIGMELREWPLTPAGSQLFAAAQKYMQMHTAWEYGNSLDELTDANHAFWALAEELELQQHHAEVNHA